MLPTNPLQHLLCGAQLPLVMTSGSLSGKPPAITNEQALDDLHTILPTVFLLHNRDVYGMDDSVIARQRRNAASFAGIRAGRDCVAARIRDVPPILCLGADHPEKHVLSGTRRTGGCQPAFRRSRLMTVSGRSGAGVRLIQSIYDFTPERIVCDAHIRAMFPVSGPSEDAFADRTVLPSCPCGGLRPSVWPLGRWK